MDDLVTTQWLADNMGARDLRIVDASWTHDADRDPRAEYLTAHIPGAVFLDLDDFTDTDATAPMMLPPAAKFASRMQALGLGDGLRIVLYDASPLHTAARAWWMMRHFGLADLAILDGGTARWRAERRQIATGEEPRRPRHMTVRDTLAPVRTESDMRANLSSHAEQMLDARPAARFRGEEPDLRPGVASGHIPGARNLPASELFAEDGTWKTGDALRAAYADAGIDLAKPLVTTCGSGITAAVLAFGAHLLGKQVALYDGSWAEWGADASTPKAMGPA